MDPIEEALSKKLHMQPAEDGVIDGVRKILDHNDQQVRSSSARMAIDEAVDVLREVGFKGGTQALRSLVRRELGRSWAGQ